VVKLLMMQARLQWLLTHQITMVVTRGTMIMNKVITGKQREVIKAITTPKDMIMVMILGDEIFSE